MFKNPSDPDNLLLIAKIKEWLFLKTGKEIIDFSVKEMGCADTHCPCVQTYIEFNNQKIVIGKPLVYVRKWDIENVLK